MGWELGAGRLGHRILPVLVLASIGLMGAMRTAWGTAEATKGLDEQDHIVRLATLEWPPYNSASLPEQGINTAVVRAAFAASGYRLEVEFFPWSRAVSLAKTSQSFIGYFPEYYDEKLHESFYVSDPAGSGQLGLAQRMDHPVQWTRIEDLSAYTIGVVQDYLNTPAFDERVHNGKQRVDVAISDAVNLRKLAAGRFPLAIIDPRVFQYLLRHDPELSGAAASLQMNSTLLEDKNLFVCFRKNTEGARALEILNTGLRKIDPAAIMNEAWRKQTE